MEAGIEGLLLLDKPPGPTSHDMVDRVRRASGQRRVGHTGTLDPLASGLLILLVGRSTRLARYVPHSPKTYTGSLQLGWTSTTDDVTGDRVSTHTGRLPEPPEVTTAGHQLEGSGLQLPPAFSARKVGGERLYRLARRGVCVKAAAAPVEVSHFDLSSTGDPALYAFSAEVSAGTYIRGLVRDLGAKLGCGAVLASLRRTAIGRLRVDDALELAADPAVAAREPILAALIPLKQIPLDLPDVTLPTEDVRRFGQGLAVVVAGQHGAGVPVRVLDFQGALLGVGECSEGLLRPRVVLAAAADPGL